MGKTKGYAEAGIDVVKDFRQDISDKWNDIRDWGQDKIDKANTFITHNTDQLNVNTETFQTVKQVYKDYWDKGININKLDDVESYIEKQGAKEFIAMMNNSAMLDASQYPNEVFFTEIDASTDFHKVANPTTISDNREVGTVIIPVPVKFEDQNGNEFVVKMYTYDDPYEGMEGNVITGTVARGC